MPQVVKSNAIIGKEESSSSSGNRGNDKANIESEINLKRKLIEATDAVRKKFNSLKTREVESKLALEKIYEPITKPLKHISVMAEEMTSKSAQPSTLKSKKRARSSSKSSHNSSSSASKITVKAGKEEESGDFTMDDDDYGENRSIQMGMETPPTTSPSSFGASPADLSESINQSSGRDLLQKHLAGLKADKGKHIYDTVYGVRIHPINKEKMLMGNDEIRFSNDGNITLWRRNKKLATFQGSKNLYDMIFLKEPSAALRGDINDMEREAYADILKLTNVIHINYNTRAGVNSRRMMKYTHIIKPLMLEEEGEGGGKSASTSSAMDNTPPPPLMRETKKKKKKRTLLKYSGKGIDRSHLVTSSSSSSAAARKVFNNDRVGAIDYVYWNTPKELIERLRLLWSSKMAGHNGHDNEIISILEELKEEGFIF